MLALLQNWTLFLTVSNLSSSHLISYFCLVDWANCQIFHLQSNSRSQRLDLTLFDKKSIVSSYILPCMLSWHVTILMECFWTLLCLFFWWLVKTWIPHSEYLCLLEGLFSVYLWVLDLLDSAEISHPGCLSTGILIAFSRTIALQDSIYCGIIILVLILMTIFDYIWLYQSKHYITVCTLLSYPDALVSGTIHFIVQCFLIIVDLWHLLESRLGGFFPINQLEVKQCKAKNVSFQALARRTYWWEFYSMTIAEDPSISYFHSIQLVPSLFFIILSSCLKYAGLVVFP